MDLYSVMRTQSACRDFAERDVPVEVLERVFEAARFAPQGGNQQPVRFIVVRDAQLRQQMSSWYLELWEPYVSLLSHGASDVPAALKPADRFARAFDRIPVLVVVCARVAFHPRDEGAADVTRVEGASTYPMVQNVLLGCRNEGLGSTLTTLLCRKDGDVRQLLKIPDEYRTWACLAIGWPARPFPASLRRMSVQELVWTEQWGRPLG